MPVTKDATKKTRSFGKTKKGRKAHLAAIRPSSKRCREAEQLAGPPSPDAAVQDSTPHPDTTPSNPTPQIPDASAANSVASSASKRKLAYCAEPEISSTQLPSTIVDLDAPHPLFANLLCPCCFESSVTLRGDSTKNSGLALFLKVVCASCQAELSSTFTSKICEGRVFDVNRRAIATALATGMGHAGLTNFSEMMNIPPVHHKTFNVHTKAIRGKSSEYTKGMLSKAVEAVKAAYPEQSQAVTNVNVSYDGSWHKRGHTSKSGIGCVIERKTGLVVDFEVLTSYCATCATTGEKLKREDQEKYERWFSVYKTVCEKNYEGTSGGMEKEAALIMWKRSVEKNGLRYISMISDGDSKTIAEIHKADPYPGITVQKHECVNHVGKRMGTGLRNLVKTKSKEKPKVTLGGRGYGKLRPDVVTKLQKYYANAIRSNKTVPEMRRAIMATLKHCSSTDAAPNHDDCPSGNESWCFYQRAIAMGHTPGSHKDELNTPLCQQVADAIRPVYERMSTTDLLSRCVLQTTQNANESVHSVIWARCPKARFRYTLPSRDCSCNGSWGV